MFNLALEEKMEKNGKKNSSEWVGTYRSHGVALNMGGVVRDCLDRHQKIDLEIVHINDLAEPAVLAHLLEFDSVHGRWQADITSDENHLQSMAPDTR